MPWATDFSLLKNFHTGSGAHLACYSMRARGSFLGGKWPGCDVDHSPSSKAEVKNEWSYTSTLPICLHGMYVDNFTLMYWSLVSSSPVKNLWLLEDRPTLYERWQQQATCSSVNPLSLS
jgi:hypothetical protein